MDLNKLKEKLLKMGQSIDLQVHEETAQSITLHATITAKNYYKNSIYLRVDIFASGTMHMFLTFNEIERTYERLYAINTFNAENAWFKAYIAHINNKDFLELHYSSVALENEQEVLNTFGFLLSELLTDNTLTYLKPILNDE